MPTLEDLLNPEATTILQTTGGELDPANKLATLLQKTKPSEAAQKSKVAVRTQLGAVDQLARTFADLQKSGTGVEKAFGQGRVSGTLQDVVTGPLGVNPAVHPFEGQRKYAAVSLARIAAGSGRLSVEMVKHFLEALPSNNSNWQEFAGHTFNAVMDAFNQKAASEDINLTSDPEAYRKAQNFAYSLVGRWMPTEEFQSFLERSQVLQPAGQTPPLVINPQSTLTNEVLDNE